MKTNYLKHILLRGDLVDGFCTPGDIGLEQIMEFSVRFTPKGDRQAQLSMEIYIPEAELVF